MERCLDQQSAVTSSSSVQGSMGDIGTLTVYHNRVCWPGSHGAKKKKKGRLALDLSPLDGLGRVSLSKAMRHKRDIQSLGG